MDLQTVMGELEALGKAQTKKLYLSNGAREPVWGVPTGAMRALFKEIKRNQPLAEQLYATGNYDAMYFAGMIADPKVMREADFDRWIESAYFFMVSDYVVAVSLAETAFAQQVADRWIRSGQELVMSAGWACYEWLLGSRPDGEFDAGKLKAMLALAQSTIHASPSRTRYAMNGFVIAVGVSYLPLHDEAVKVAAAIGQVEVVRGKTKCAVALASEAIQKAVDKNRLGFKRRNVRC